MIFGLIKKSFNQVVKNSSITMFFVLYLIATGFIIPFARTKFLALSLGICTFLLFVVFISGWLQVIKETAQTEMDKILEKNYFAIFLEAIGKNFLPVLIATIFYFVLLSIVTYLTGIIATKFFGSFDFILRDLTAANIESNEKLMEYFLNLPVEKKYTLYGWQLSFIVSISAFMFLFMNYCPALIDCKNENMFLKPFVAFIESIKFLFKNFLGCLGVFSLLYVLYIFFEILNTFTGFNIILSVLSLFAFIYFLATTVMLIFNYYEEKNNCPDGPDCVGEDETCNSVGESD